eukprot:CAMPEP_0113607106 /NCGR_PEP_ID=MMETSP0017_2-20120614/3207_1 /TAXON_ID=2856 /ORGANISM="Cylindrotheca closterium" /LENGTH=1280 /DNA_ID=CAMNT_0000515687 /DNA_START=340 /DNA_END=4180 /DNA_ORIENTATION=- /assembly_acc=CAM_ASM_000147
MPSSRSSRGRRGNDSNSNSNTPEPSTYEEIMGIAADGAKSGGADALSSRLISFRKWVVEDAKMTVHPSVCIVNGEATDGTKHAPVLLFGPPPGSEPLARSTGEGRVGGVDEADRALYERTIGCQVRTAKLINEQEVMMACPRMAMITPDVVAASDAGRAILGCCKPLSPSLPLSSSLEQGVDGDIADSGNNNTTTTTTNFWDVFENTTVCEDKFAQKVARSAGPQLVIKILQERKRAESVFLKTQKEIISNGESNNGAIKEHKLIDPGVLSTRAPLLAFLIHQRFSPQLHPPVVSEEQKDFEAMVGESALNRAKPVTPKEGAPKSFGPYARTMPSSVSLPICWKRNELALLSGCITGIPPLQEVTSTTLQLVTEFVALVEAGILERFPSIFPPGLITWERWVWAAAVYMSRALPVTCYLNEGETNAVAHVPQNENDMQSPRETWDELGVMIPLLDMLNHEVDSHSVSWQQNVEEGTTSMTDGDGGTGEITEAHPPRAMMNKKVRKGQQIYTNYGADKSNQILMLQYGFALLSNTSDEARLGWGLMDAIGKVAGPSDYNSLIQIVKKDEPYQVFESLESQAVNEWWSDERLKLLESEAFSAVGDSFMSSLKLGKKMTGTAYGDGTYDPTLLTAALIGTMPTPELKVHMSKLKKEEEQHQASGETKRVPVEVTKRHQRVLRSYLLFVFTRKLEKLLENLFNGLKGHFGSFQLWTKASKGGIRYQNEENDGAEGGNVIGWQQFFDENAYAATMEVEKRYYALGPESCVLTLYDGQLQALQNSIDGVTSAEKFEESVLKQLADLDFVIVKGDDPIPEDESGLESESMNVDKANKGKQGGAPNGGGKDNAGKREKGDQKKSNDKSNRQQKDDDKKDGKSPSKSSRRRNRRGKNNNEGQGGMDRAPVTKLHIGNLAYSTNPADLYEFFSIRYGRESVLECHIPTERESGKSRGFGFVTLPDNVARRILAAGKFELDGRVLRIAESNSTGTNRGNGRFPPMPPPPPPPPMAGDRCNNCGYRPKYCECAAPSFPSQNQPNQGHMDGSYGRDFEYFGPNNEAIAETVAAAEADHLGIMEGTDEALERIMIGITLGADGTIGAGREATAGIVVEADVDDVIVLEIALGTDLAVGQGVDQDRTVTRGIDLPHDQGTRDVIAREIDPVIGPRHERDLGIDLIDPASVVAGKATIMVEALRPNAAEAQAQLTLAKIARATQPMAQLQRTTTAKMVKCPTGVRKKILEGGAVGAEAVEETEREEKRVVMPAVEAALLALPTTRGSKVYGTSRLW